MEKPPVLVAVAANEHLYLPGGYPALLQHEGHRGARGLEEVLVRGKLSENCVCVCLRRT
jgi:hypothetical protein